ncbi:MAG TPA: hypothetical protein VH764_02750 [Gemmatimonadales bacterium]|jgi:hypothetical protein
MQTLGITIHDPDVVLTDLGLAILGAWFARRLGAPEHRRALGRAPAVLMAGLAGAAFCGAVFHAFFPRQTETWPGYLAWIPVSLSIVVAASALLELGIGALAPGFPERTRRGIVVAYAMVFAAVVVLVDGSFGSIVRFYVPALLIFLVGATVRAARQGGGWIAIALGLALSAAAAVLQQLRVSIHPMYFDHNAVYHVVQAGALVLLYLGFLRIAEAPAQRRAVGVAGR